MPAGEERQRSVLDEDSTGNEGLVVLSDRGLSDPGYWLLENGFRLAQYKHNRGRGSKRCKTKRQLFKC